MNSHATTILAVDDDRTTLMMLEAQLRQHGHHVITASGGEEALKLAQLHAASLDAIVLDRLMPGIDGLTVVRQLKQDAQLRWIPVVMQTGSDSPEQVREGIDAGVFYYLTKPVQEGMLRSVVAAALRERMQSRVLTDQQSRDKLAFGLIETARLHCRTLEEAESLAVFLAYSFPDPSRVVTGLAELLVNAIEHGNLGVGYTEKTRLLGEGSWRSEINRRLQLAPYQQRKVEVLLQLKPEAVYVQITDEGEGFDWKDYLVIDPSRAMDNHGRGIAQANSQSFDALRYNVRGNQAVAVVYRDKQHTQALEW
jgi:two-component system cell cycle response regulator